MFKSLLASSQAMFCLFALAAWQTPQAQLSQHPQSQQPAVQQGTALKIGGIVSTERIAAIT
jgi:hypothetical protein